MYITLGAEGTLECSKYRKCITHIHTSIGTYSWNNEYIMYRIQEYLVFLIIQLRFRPKASITYITVLD